LRKAEPAATLPQGATDFRYRFNITITVIVC
jgi:hypothetical protein